MENNFLWADSTEIYRMNYQNSANVLINTFSFTEDKFVVVEEM